MALSGRDADRLVDLLQVLLIRLYAGKGFMENANQASAQTISR